MSTIQERLKKVVEKSGYSTREIAQMTGFSKSAVQRYISGTSAKIPITFVSAVARVTSKSAAYIMGWEEELPDGLEPLPPTKQVPLLGAIACGEPILAVENYEGYVSMPDTVSADYALRCKGDSMIGARINDGDIVYIRKQDDVENGEIAAVLIDDEVTLKRVYKTGQAVILQAENPAYPPRILTELSGTVRIIGKAVGFYSDLK